MNRRSFLNRLTAFSLLAVGCQTVEECACEVETLPVLPPRNGGRLIIQVDSQHFVDEAIWLAEHLRAKLLKNSTLMVEPIVVGLPPGCPTVGAPVPAPIVLPSEMPIEIPTELTPEKVEDDGTFEERPAATVVPAGFHEETIVGTPYTEGGTRLRIRVDDFHPYLPMKLSATLIFESAATGFRFNTFQNTWTGPMDDQPIANSSHELRRDLVRPRPEITSRFNSVIANSPREFLFRVADELVPTVVSSVH